MPAVMRNGGILEVLSFAATDVGRARCHNEDSYLIDRDVRLYTVADGMGGAAGGQVASKIAVETIDATMKAELEARRIEIGSYAGPASQHPVRELIELATERASAAIRRAAEDDPRLCGMGTTATSVVVLEDGHAVVAHVGDSRAYLVRGDRIVQISDDHSLVAEQLRAGLITEEQARTSPFKNIIVRALGVDERGSVKVDTKAVPLEEGDHIVLCTDGLVAHVEPEEIRDMVYDSFLKDAPRKLVELANQRGGRDNVTVVVLHVR